MLRFLKLTRTRLASRVRAVLAQTRGYGVEGADDDAESQDDVEIVQPLGLMVRPYISAGLELLAAEIGDTTLGLAIINKALEILDVEEGETRLYGAAEPTARVRLRASGKTEVESKSGQDIVLNGGTLEAARRTDTTGNGTLTLVGATSGLNVILTLTYTPPGGAPQVSSITLGPASIIATVPLTHALSGTITSGATRVKA